MGLISRIGDLIHAKATEKVREQEKKNAGAIAEQADEKIQVGTDQLTIAVGQEKATVDRTQKRLDEAKAEAAKWRGLGQQAYDAGNMEKAQKAAGFAKVADANAKSLEADLKSARDRYEKDRKQLEVQQIAAQQAHNTAQEVKSSEDVAKAQEKVSQTANANNPNSEYAKLERAKENVEDRRAATEAIQDVRGEDPYFQDLKDKADTASIMDEFKKNSKTTQQPPAEPAKAAPAEAGGWNIVG